MPRQCHVAHRTPGRIRYRVPEAKGDRAFMQQVHQQLASVEGVQHVESNPVTGSVVVRYSKDDPATEQRVEKAIQEQNALLSLAVPDIARVEQIAKFVGDDVAILARRSRAAAALLDTLNLLNQQLKRATNNAVDLKLLLPLACAAGSLLFIDRKRDPFLWSMLLFASFHTFLTLHQPPVVVSQKVAQG